MYEAEFVIEEAEKLYKYCAAGKFEESKRKALTPEEYYTMLSNTIHQASADLFNNIEYDDGGTVFHKLKSKFDSPVSLYAHIEGTILNRLEKLRKGDEEEEPTDYNIIRMKYESLYGSETGETDE